MRILGIFCLLLTLSGCSSLLFYPEPGQIFTPEKAKLEYRTVTLVTSLAGALVFAALHGWIVWKLCTPAVRDQFRSAPR